MNWAVEGFNDLQKQGFMKLGRVKPKCKKAKKHIITCDKCGDWHRQGEHTK